MYTSHGYHIIGSLLGPWTEDMRRVRCGGPRLCKVCGAQVLNYLYSEHEDPENGGRMYTSHGHPIPGIDAKSDEVRPPVHRCGGVRTCKTCAIESVNALSEELRKRNVSDKSEAPFDITVGPTYLYN